MSRDLLGSIPSPVPIGDEDTFLVSIETEELTFLGATDQPDFGHLTVTYRPHSLLVELKSFKKYVQSFRDKKMSYERFAVTIRADLLEVYDPEYLMVEVTFRPRGGASTTVKAGAQ